MKQTCTAKKRRKGKGKGKGKGPVNTLMQLVPATGMQPKPSAHRPPFHTSPSLHGTHCSGARPRREDTPGRRNQSRCRGPPCDHTARVLPVIIQLHAASAVEPEKSIISEMGVKISNCSKDLMGGGSRRVGFVPSPFECWEQNASQIKIVGAILNKGSRCYKQCDVYWLRLERRTVVRAACWWYWTRRRQLRHRVHLHGRARECL